MKLYDTIAAEYETLFPSSKEKVSFTEGVLLEHSVTDILDLGCATGQFAFQLARKERTITLLDPDDQMIEHARSQGKLTQTGTFSFIHRDMLSFLSTADHLSFDTVLCMGNTLAYLDGTEELEQFLSYSRRALKRGGVMILQILNYWNPVIQDGFSFPVLETDNMKFYRSYTSHEDPLKLRFITKVTDRETGETLGDIHTHSAFTAHLIEKVARRAGFKSIELYGGYDRHPLQENDFFCLIVIER
ncbi:MAG: class I SAM-dependent methyltransferase [Sphaerochaetaceae bacterium]|nr:class I SAM-dependent methyltransferase [Sphaerochaetaceae bacterium]